MSKAIAISLTLAALVVGVALGAFVTGIEKGKLSGVTVENEYFQGDVSVVGTLTSSDVTATDDLVVTDDVTILGGTLTITTAANATSPATVGCVSSYPTSSATQVKQIYNTVATTTGNGFVLWKYGSCP